MRLRGNLAYRTGAEEAAFGWCDRAGAAGQPLGWRHAAVQALRSRGVDASIEWWSKLAGQDDTDAMVQLATIALGWGETVDAHEWLERAAALGSGDAMFTLGERASQTGETGASLRWWVRAARAGQAAAMAALATPRPLGAAGTPFVEAAVAIEAAPDDHVAR